MSPARRAGAKKRGQGESGERTKKERELVSATERGREVLPDVARARGEVDLLGVRFFFHEALRAQLAEDEGTVRSLESKLRERKSRNF